MANLPPPEPEPERSDLYRPVGVGSASLAVLALVACVYALHWAAAVFIPLLLAMMFSYALSPVVDRLARHHVPRWLGAAAVMLALLGSFGTTIHALGDDATALVESLPDAAQKLGDSLRRIRGAPRGTMEKVQNAATRLEQAAEESGATPPRAGKGVTRVQVERPRFNVKDYLWSGTLGLVGFFAQAMAVCFITYFLMASGDTFRRKMVRIAGPTFSQKKITIQTLDEITQQIHLYLMVQIGTSVLVGVATWLAMLGLGLERAAVWGVAAAALNLVPYLGSVVITGALAMAALLQFGTLAMALSAGAASLLVHTVAGQLLTPWVTSRAARMNPVVIFVGVLAWGWLWGAWGLFLGAPMLMVVKAVCDRVDDLKPLGELLGS